MYGSVFKHTLTDTARNSALTVLATAASDLRLTERFSYYLTCHCPCYWLLGVTAHLNVYLTYCIWPCSEFEVASLNFPGQVHRWRLSLLLQRGTERSHEALLKDAARALTLLIVTGRARVTADRFSVKQSLKSLLLGLTR